MEKGKSGNEHWRTKDVVLNVGKREIMDSKVLAAF